MEKEHKNKCILVGVGLTEVKPPKEIKPKIIINYSEKVIKLDYPTGEVLFNGGSLWREYKIKCNEENIIFGFVNSIGDKMNYWAKENHYIAIDKKSKIILGLLKREMGWGGSFGQKYSDWKEEIIKQNEEVKPNKNKRTKEQIKEEKEQAEAKAFKSIEYIRDIFNHKDFIKVVGKRFKGYFREVKFIYENDIKTFLLRKLEYKVLCKELKLNDITLIQNEKKI